MSILKSLAPCSVLLLAAACATPQPESETLVAAVDQPSDQADAGGETSRTPARGHGKTGFMETYDHDGDGQVTEAEFMTEREQGYLRRDADGDGAVHAEEYVAEYEGRLQEQLEDTYTRQIEQAYVRFGVLDSDDDEVMTLSEFHASGTRMFSRLDSNGDGVVNADDTSDRY